MSAILFDTARWKAEERRRWGDAAEAWSRWDQWQVAGRGSDGVTRRMLEMVQLAPGDRVLDVGTGIGEPALTAAQHVGPTGSVVGIDQAAPMIARARERARDLGLGNVELLEMDAEGLELSGRVFDVLLCRWALMLLPSLHETLRSFRHLLRPEGRLSVAVWGAAERVPVLSLAPTAVRRFLGAPNLAPALPTPFSLADPARLIEEVVRGGFDRIELESVEVCMSFPSLDTFVEYAKAMSKTTLALLADETPERREDAWNEVRKAARPFVNEAGEVRFTNESICLAACRPA